ncbi:uncharacterized protein C8A04DRAFT_24041 [Dichotomopilus funicola]|uniref:DUF6590 domain-containing protein n=1 Tax=Dichotomopilus funicola TaxID=1934379 RepID=A0AAN6VBI4_9PEZI|nr:hypothetical protein C8A04DRAFT_24041 [Dichotomopilus funicola]
MEPGWSDWSAWEWDVPHARWWRARRDPQGIVHYDYQHPDVAPRGSIQGLTEAFNNVQLGGHQQYQQDPYYHQNQAYTHNAPLPTGGGVVVGGSAYGAPSAPSDLTSYPSGKGTAAASSTYPESRPREKKHSSRKHRSRTSQGTGTRGTQEPSVPHADYSSSYQNTSTATASSGHDPRPQAEIDNQPEDDESTAERYTFGQGAPAGTEKEGTMVPESGNVEYTSADDRGPDMQSAGQGSDESPLSSDQLQDFLSQTNPYLTGAPDPSYPTGEPSLVTVGHDYPQYDHEINAGRDTPRASAQPRTHWPPYHEPTAARNQDGEDQSSLTGSTNTGREPFQTDGYTVEPSSRFQPGEIFKIVWYEPLGAGAPARSDVMTQRIRVNTGGEPYHQGLRRFIVVANDEGHCTCVPILTYERQACLKKGVKAAKHGVIHQVGRRPRTLPGEPQLGFPPVRVELYERTEQLVKESRVNYAKLTTVEHNFRVLFIGRVLPDDFENIVIQAIDVCWGKKKRR